MKCQECGSKLEPEAELFKDVIPFMKKLLKEKYEPPDGYVCSNYGCVAMYDKDFKRLKITLGRI